MVYFSHIDDDKIIGTPAGVPIGNLSPDDLNDLVLYIESYSEPFTHSGRSYGIAFYSNSKCVLTHKRVNWLPGVYIGTKYNYQVNIATSDKDMLTYIKLKYSN